MTPDSLKYWLTSSAYAHRGLFAPGTEREENTLAAVEAASEHGFGCEVDLQLSADGQVLVFHDPDLKRMTGQTGRLAELGYLQLAAIPVGRSGRAMPRLPDLLAKVAGRAPLLLELKCPPGTDHNRLCAAVYNALEDYAGHIAVMSFEARLIAWFARHAPAIARGLVLGPETFGSFMRRLWLRRYLLAAKPQFFAVSTHSLQASLVQRWRRQGYAVLTWTVGDTAAANRYAEHADALIFETPALAAVRAHLAREGTSQ